MGLWEFLKNQSPPLIRQATRDMEFMLETAQELFTAACAYLLDNEPLDVDLSARDKQINERETKIRRAVVEHLSIAPKDDLVYSLVLVSVVQEAERTGDLAKTLAKTADLAHKPRLGLHVEPLRTLRDRILEMFALSRRGFGGGDEQAARKVVQMHQENKAQVADYLRQVAEASDVTANEAMVFALSATLMNRVSAHLSNILSAIVVPYHQIRRYNEIV